MENIEIKAIIEDVLHKMTVEVESIEMEDNGFNTTFQIHTADAGILIGNRGETLDALSYIIRRIVQQKINDREKKAVFIVDINNYQTKKLDEFKEGLNTSADRVRLFKEPVELSPMTSYERMIVHSTFSDDPEINTASEGEGKFRRVVLKHAGSVSSSEIEKEAEV